MSRGRQHGSWAMKPKNRVLMSKAEAAHFHHSFGLGGDYGLTYQACRFCGSGACETEDDSHGDCYIRKRWGGPCRGLWKYSVRHYVCIKCRKSLLLGLRPRRAVEEETP